MQARVVLYLLPLVAALSIGAAEAQRIQWGNYLVTEELLLFPEVNVGAALCSLESNFSSPGLRLGIGGAWTVSENLFDADGTSVSSQKLESTPGFDDVIAPLTDLNGDGRLEIGFSGDVEFLRQRVYIGSHTSEGFINTTNLLTLDPSQPPLSRFSVLQQRYNTSNYAFGLSVTYIGDVDNNGVGDIAISGGHTSSYTATAFHILFLEKNLEVLNVTTITLFPDESVAAFAINSELGIDFTSFASSIADKAVTLKVDIELGEGYPLLETVPRSINASLKTHNNTNTKEKQREEKEEEDTNESANDDSISSAESALVQTLVNLWSSSSAVSASSSSSMLLSAARVCENWLAVFIERRQAACIAKRKEQRRKQIAAELVRQQQEQSSPSDDTPKTRPTSVLDKIVDARKGNLTFEQRLQKEYETRYASISREELAELLKKMAHKLKQQQEKEIRLQRLNPVATTTRGMLPLRTLCLKNMAKHLLYYESLEGVPLFIRTRIFGIIVQNYVLHPLHLALLLEDDVKKLDLSPQATFVTDEHLYVISLRCRNLRNLNLQGCAAITDEGLASICSTNHQLAKINLQGCKKLTSRCSGCRLSQRIGDVDGDNIPDMAATAETDEGTLLFILFLTPEGNVKKYRIHSTESVYNPPGTNRPRELWNWGIIKSMGVEAALTEAERFSSADYNNDQHPDLILASLQMGDTWMLFLDDKGNITGNMYYGAGIQREGSGVAVVDANDDSVPDVVLSKDFPVDQGTIKVLLMDAIRITVTSASFSEEEDEEEEEEGEDSQTRTLLATFQVELSARPRFAIQVDFQVETSDNISDEDVVLLSPSPLNFEADQTSTVVQVSVVLPVEDVINRRQQQEPTITLVLTSAKNALVSSSSNSFLLSLVNSEESSNNDDEDSSDEETNVIVPIVVTIVVVLLVLLAGVGFGVWWRRRKMQIQKRMRVDSQYGVMEGGNRPKRDDDEEEDEDEGFEMKGENLWNIAYHKLTFVEKIGEGAFGEVWKGMWRNSEVAIKKLHTMDDDQLQDFQTEAQTLKGLRPHGNVIQLLGVVNEPDKPFCIVTEFMDKGDLNSYLLQHKDSIDADTMLKWAIDIASGMHHLHSEGITHRDLATRNLLLTKALRLKVADFGMSRKMDKKGGAQKTTNDVGPLKWMAPEAIEDHIYSEKSDVWSFGVCLWEISSFGAVPFEGLSAVNAAVKVCQQREALEPPENSPPVLREVMLTCWAFSPEDRPTFGAILQTLKEKATNALM